MNAAYLDSLPAVTLNPPIALQEGEKVVFAETISMLGNEKGQMLGSEFTKGHPHPTVVLTNRRLILNTGAGAYTLLISEVAHGTLVHGERSIFGWKFMKWSCFAISLNKTIPTGSGKLNQKLTGIGQNLTGFELYFKKDAVESSERFKQILEAWFGRS